MASGADGLTRTILFVCLHGSAKSLTAAEHLNRLAALYDVDVRGESAGIERDADVPARTAIVARVERLLQGLDTT